MYPFLRLIKEVFKFRKAPQLGFGDVHISHHMCMPWDLDPWVELNNGRTLTLYDLGRIPLAARSGLLNVLKERRWGMTMAYVFDYYFNHASIIAIGFYIIFGHKQALQKGAWLRTFGRIQLLALLALVVNLITGGNYMYLMEPPIVDNPLIIQSESFHYMHVVFFQVFAAVHFFLLQVVLSRLKVKRTLSY